MLLKYGDKKPLVSDFQQLLVWWANANMKTDDLVIDGSWGDRAQALYEKFLEAEGQDKTIHLTEKTFEKLRVRLSNLEEIENHVKVVNDFSEQVLIVAQYILAQKPMEYQIKSEGIKNNGGLYVKWVFNLTDDSWDDNLHGTEYAHCAAFVIRCLKIASKLTGIKSPIKTIAKNWRVPNIASEAKEKNLFISGDKLGTVKPGDLILYRKANGSWRHTGIVESVDGDSLKTIESNTCGNCNCQTVRRIVNDVNSVRWDFVSI